MKNDVNLYPKYVDLIESISGEVKKCHTNLLLYFAIANGYLTLKTKGRVPDEDWIRERIVEVIEEQDLSDFIKSLLKEKLAQIKKENREPPSDSKQQH